ncbi:MAG TPA: hypothetical protein VE779_08100 [Candidatus Angelobacter sp.]|nr:hypothetical protein [Candidatus Angelobacter sp.]
MGVRLTTATANTAQNALPANATETVLYVTPPIIQASDASCVFFRWYLNIIPGTGTSALSIRLRRGVTTAGVLLGAATWLHSVTAGLQLFLSGCYFDIPGVMETAYCFTLAQSGASAAGTLQDGCLIAFIL